MRPRRLVAVWAVLNFTVKRLKNAAPRALYLQGPRHATEATLSDTSASSNISMKYYCSRRMVCNVA
jgi:hypothetical protein